ncbi:MAG: hypothetical protein OEM89_00770 [Nitrosopumilus sp.]|nr:hypothetical protein [Nitrosopumilus sp.]
MPLEDHEIVYGNLHAYKMYTRPKAHRLFGSESFRKKPSTKHHENIQRMLEILALNGTLTTWGMAKTHMDNSTGIRTKEKEYRRFLMGRMARGKHTIGVLEAGLVIKDGKSYAKAPADQYRLSLHGILYCLDVLDLSYPQIDRMAENYGKILPLVFGKWNYLKENIGNQVYRLKKLASGLFMDEIQISKISNFPVFELMTYLNVKYQNNFEQIDEEELANQISIWFYTNLLVPTKFRKSGRRRSLEIKQWKKIVHEDPYLKKWYYGFLKEAMKFFNKRFSKIKKLESI